jgi:hypothetical protein
VNQPGGVGGGQRVGDLGEQPAGLGRRQGSPLADEGLEGRPGDVLHHQVGQAVGGIDDGVDGDDVVVAEAGGEPGLADQAGAGVGAVVLGPQHLDGDGALERLIDGAVDDAHAAAADLRLQVIGPQRAQVARLKG